MHENFCVSLPSESCSKRGLGRPWLGSRPPSRASCPEHSSSAFRLASVTARCSSVGTKECWCSPCTSCRACCCTLRSCAFERRWWSKSLYCYPRDCGRSDVVGALEVGVHRDPPSGGHEPSSIAMVSTVDCRSPTRGSSRVVALLQFQSNL